MAFGRPDIIFWGRSNFRALSWIPTSPNQTLKAEKLRLGSSHSIATSISSDHKPPYIRKRRKTGRILPTIKFIG
jgi:hypothetical protein